MIGHTEGLDLAIWDLPELANFIRECPDAAKPLTEFIRPSDANVEVNAEGWTIPADAFVLPIGPAGALTGSTYRYFIRAVGPEIEKQVAAKLPLTFSPNSPITVAVDGLDEIRSLLVATAYDGDGVFPRQATEAVLRLAAQRRFRTITLPLIGAAGTGDSEAIKQIVAAIHGTILPRPLSVNIVVLNEGVANLVRDALRHAQVEGTSPTGNQAFEPSRAFFVNDGVDASRDNDRLDIVKEAEVFARLLAASDASMPLAVGLFGHWGSGKSFFMELVEKEVEAVTRQARGEYSPAGTRESNDPPTYCSNVVHIRFNAWHYMDKDLWASIGLRIFEGLAEHLQAGADGESELARRKRELGTVIESQKRERAQAEEALKEATKQRDEMRADLDKARKTRTGAANKTSVIKALEDAKDLYHVAKKLGVADPENLNDLETEIARARETAASLRLLLPGWLSRRSWPLQFVVLAGAGLGLGYGVDALEYVQREWIPALKPDLTAAITSITLAAT